MVKPSLRAQSMKNCSSRGIDLRLEEGDFCTVIGGNGAGKKYVAKLHRWCIPSR